MERRLPRLILILILLLLFYPTLLASVSKKDDKTFEAVYTGEAPTIDGIIDDAAWNDLPLAMNFIQYEPYNGNLPSQKTVVKMIYDNRAVYIAAQLYDTAPDSILTELGKRDQTNLNADEFWVDISPYNDGQNSFEFRITASGIQIDRKHSGESSDKQWDAVWKSAVSIDSTGWHVEMEIPYSALRFPKTEVQHWGINFWREIRRTREISTWDFIDKRIDGIRNQYGILSGITGIKPPLRLSFEPYLSGYTEKEAGSAWGFRASYGADVKLGLSESFTLDMTLIPDFGQVESDDVIINLSPFETYYSEKRQFFTEGTELFNRGDVFYSRRIGSVPAGYREVQKEYEEVKENPQETQLLNAAKISGRNRNGLGIGFFNAITAASKATVVDSAGKQKKVVTQPLTNYNMVVFDQSLGNNSYVSLYNTNVYMGDFRYTANVSGTEFRLADRSNHYAFYGLLNVSQKYHEDSPPQFGHKYTVKFDKISGNFLAGIWQRIETDTWDPNDMGYESVNNVFRNGLFMRYNIYDPFWKVLDLYNLFSIELNYLYAPREYTSVEIEYRLRTTFRNRLTFGLEFNALPFKYHDYYEPRVEGWKVIYPSRYDFGFFLSPDYTKKFVVDLSAEVMFASDYGQREYEMRIGPRFRVSDHMFVELSADLELSLNDLGYAEDSLNSNGTPAIIIGERDIENVTTTLDLNYTFSSRTNISFRLRHYWFLVEYDRYYDLMSDGTLTPNDFTGQYDMDYSAFNIDMYFTWYFAPGSEIIVAWKNAISAYQDPITKSFFESFERTLSSPASNSFSLKILYYLDYQYLKKKNRKPS